MLNAFDQAFTPEMRDRAEAMNLSIYDVVKIASLIEREAVVDDERPLIADVYLKRYNDGWNLEADPTVQYVIGKRDGKWWPVPTAKDLEDTDSAYNLYKHSGLTPTPICSPRKLSMLAVCNRPIRHSCSLWPARTIPVGICLPPQAMSKRRTRN